MNGIQDHYISAVPTHFECINTSKALYDVEIIGNTGHRQLQSYQIELKSVTLLMCNSTCETLPTMLTTEQQSDSYSDTNSTSSSSTMTTALVISVVAIIISGLICISVVTMLLCVRQRYVRS